jgi:hypothetical protein
MHSPFISRVDSSSRYTHGWDVRVRWRKQCLKRFYSDRKYGGKQKALQESIACSKLFCHELHRPYCARIIRGMSGRKPPQSGFRGVSVRKRNGILLGYFSTWYPQKGVQKMKWFSIFRLGKNRALKLAISHRKEMEIKYYGTEIKDAPSVHPSIG